MKDLLFIKYFSELCSYRGLPYYDYCKTEEYIMYKIQHPELVWEDVITYVNIGLNYDFYTNMKAVNNPYGINVLVNKYYKLASNYIPTELEVITKQFSVDGLVLRHEARIAFEAMSQAALVEGNSLKAISTYRSFDYQEKVYNKNRTTDIPMDEYQKERDKVSARPGHSEHQTGLAVDINDLEETFELTPESKWLKINAHRFGFILRYPKGKEMITGYNYEPWHYRYLGKSLAEAVYFSNLTYDEFYMRFLYKIKLC